MSIPIREIWSSNLEFEINEISICLRSYNWIAIDTEFPGFLRNTPRYSPDSQIYDDMKYNVDLLNPVQLGFTLFNSNGSIGGTWQVHFCNFDDNAHNTNNPSASISLTKRKSGIDFDRQRVQGVDSRLFSFKLQNILARHNQYHQNDINWVTFHGVYDLAYTAKILTGGMPLPESLPGFHSLLSLVFGCGIYDVKFIARFCVGLCSGEIGLEKMARILRVGRMGKAHQAGSDSLLTACVYLTVIKKYGINAEAHKGFLYGVGGRVENTKKINPQVLMHQQVILVPVRCVSHPNFVEPRTMVLPYSQRQQFVPFLFSG